MDEDSWGSNNNKAVQLLKQRKGLDKLKYNCEWEPTFPLHMFGNTISEQYSESGNFSAPLCATLPRSPPSPRQTAAQGGNSSPAINDRHRWHMNRATAR